MFLAQNPARLKPHKVGIGDKWMFIDFRNVGIRSLFSLVSSHNGLIFFEKNIRVPIIEQTYLTPKIFFNPSIINIS